MAKQLHNSLGQQRKESASGRYVLMGQKHLSVVEETSDNLASCVVVSLPVGIFSAYG